MSIKRILVPVDFSACSAAAVSYALMLQKQFGAEVTVLHAFEVPMFVPPHVMVMMGEVNAPLGDHIQQEAQQQLDAYMKRLDLPAGTKIKTDVVMGPPGITILEAIGQHDAELVVMGTHGRTGLSRLVMGSTAERVVRGAPCPVLTVPLTEEDKG